MKKLLLVLALLCAPIFAQSQSVISFTIKSGTSISGPVYLGSCTIAGIEMPKSADGWTTANLSFQVTTDSTNFKELQDEFGTAKSLTATAGVFIYVSPADWWFSGTIKVRSGTSGTPVTQTADRVLKIICR